MAKAIEYKNHNDVPKKYRWELDVLLNGKSIEDRIKGVIATFRKNFIEVKDSKYDSPEAYLTAAKAAEKANLEISSVANYLSNSLSLDLTSNRVRGLLESFQFEMNKLNQEFGSEQSRILANSDKLNKWIQLPEFKDYKFAIQSSLRYKPHTLSKEIEEFKIKISRGEPDFSQIFKILTDAENDKGTAVDSRGKKTKITAANYFSLLESDDKSLRKSAYEAQRESYLRIKDTLANLLYQHKRDESVFAQAHHYKSTVDMLLFSDHTSQDILPPLYESTQKAVPALRKYAQSYDKFYKSVYGKKPERYDRQRKLIKFETDVTVEEGIDDVIKALQPFGSEYIEVVRQALDENWIDFYVVKNKRSGAYSSGSGIKQKLILMNWDNTSRSTETLAHELGHSVNSYFIDKSTLPSQANIPRLVAEVASIFNELLLVDYWTKTSKNDKMKFDILSRFIEGFSGTVFRQVMFSNYEYDFYNKVDNGEPLNSYESQSQLYFENFQKYGSHPLKSPNLKLMYNAVRIPHFYYGFYVHRYAIGQLVACIFFQRYRDEGLSALQVYIKNFLSKGRVDTPINILKNAGIDLRDPKSYELGFKFFSDLVNEYTRLGTKLFLKSSKFKK